MIQLPKIKLRTECSVVLIDEANLVIVLQHCEHLLANEKSACTCLHDHETELFLFLLYFGLNCATSQQRKGILNQQTDWSLSKSMNDEARSD